MERDWARAEWRKSTTSDTGACVEVAYMAGWVGVRDTKANGDGPVLEFNGAEWRAFLTGAIAGEFDLETLSRSL